MLPAAAPVSSCTAGSGTRPKCWWRAGWLACCTGAARLLLPAATRRARRPVESHLSDGCCCATLSALAHIAAAAAAAAAVLCCARVLCAFARWSHDLRRSAIARKAIYHTKPSHTNVRAQLKPLHAPNLPISRSPFVGLEVRLGAREIGAHGPCKAHLATSKGSLRWSTTPPARASTADAHNALPRHHTQARSDYRKHQA